VAQLWSCQRKATLSLEILAFQSSNRILLASSIGAVLVERFAEAF